MTDIQQWRRKIHPIKTRTTANLPALVVDLEESDDLRPPTPKRGLKPRLSSYFDKPSKPVASTEDYSVSQLPKWPCDQIYPNPKPEEEMDAIMCHLMTEPYASLDVHFNASLMRVFESYLTLQDWTNRLQKRCDEALATAQAVIEKLRIAEKDWEEEKISYKEDVKRLEVLLSRASSQGVAAVTLARQESKLHGRYTGSGRKNETVFEFLEKTTKHHDNITSWSNQRATKKPLLQSNSDQDLDISRQLAQKKSMTNIHSDLPFGTPPEKDDRFSLTNMSILDQKAAIPRIKRPINGSTTTDDTFSCAGDLLPDERSVHHSQADHAAEDPDMATVENIANVLAHRRGVSPSQAMPQLLGLFGDNPDGIANRTYSVPIALEIASPERMASMKALTSGIVKRATMMTKTSGLFQKKPRPQLDIAATQLAVSRRFSFEPGDDVVDQSFASPSSAVSVDDSKSRRGSVSICSKSSRTPSRIPTPVYTPGAVRPRREREESWNSLLTVIKRSEDGDSRTSSVYSSPSECREEGIKTSPYQDRKSLSQPRLRKSNLLLDHTNDLRGSGSARGNLSGHGSLSDNVRLSSTDWDGHPV